MNIQVMKHIDRNSIERVPTRGERWVGIMLSVLITMLCVPVSIFAFSIAEHDRAGMGAVVTGVVFGLMGVAGIVVFCRMVFTKAQAASSNANRVYAWGVVSVLTLLAIFSFMSPAQLSNRILIIVLLCGALAHLGRVIRKVSRTKQN